jgi:hypothetical protein
MTATDEMIGIIPPIVVAGAVTKLASTMFPSETKTKTRYVTRKVKRKTSKKASRKSNGKWAKSVSREVKKYL